MKSTQHNFNRLTLTHYCLNQQVLSLVDSSVPNFQSRPVAGASTSASAASVYLLSEGMTRRRRRRQRSAAAAVGTIAPGKVDDFGSGRQSVAGAHAAKGGKSPTLTVTPPLTGEIKNISKFGLGCFIDSFS